MMADFGNIIDVLNEAVFEEGKSIGVIFDTRINLSHSRLHLLFSLVPKISRS
jgi:hypothetical protein